MTQLSRWLTFRPWERHGLVLMVGGLVYVALGFGIFTVGDPTPVQKRALIIALNLWPLKIWGIAFIAAGILAIISSRWPSFADSWGYVVLTSLTSAWAAVYLLGYFLADAPPRNLNSGLMWCMVAFMWWAISGLTNPDRRLVVRDEPN